MALAITGISPNPIDYFGGTKITVEGTFDIGVAHRAFIGTTGTVNDTQCYSGVIGTPLDLFSEDGQSLSFVSPPSEKGANFATVALASTPATNDTIALVIVEPSWKFKVHQMRKNCPKWYETGARSLSLEKRL